MSAGWVAAGIRGQGLSRRRIGSERARTVAACPSVADAIRLLASTPYGPEVQSAADLPSARRGVEATLLWHLRILAGWCPPSGTAPVRVLGAGFEIRNVVDHLLRLAGHSVPTPFVLGSLGRAWTSVARCRTPSEVRTALAHSTWGDPGTEDPGGIRVALQATWAAEVYATVPSAADWAKKGALLLIERIRSAGAEELIASNAQRRLLHLMGSGPPTGAASDAEPWRREVLWLRDVQRDSARLASRPPRDPASVVGATGLLATDAWLTRAALGLAATGGADLGELVGAAGW